jgi:hypothetical protein
MASTRSNSKPNWSPTESYYDRILSSFWSRNKQSRDPHKSTIPISGQVGKAGNYFEMRNNSEEDWQHVSQNPGLVPNLRKPIAACYKGSDQNYMHANQIVREVEYGVTTSD